MTCSCKTKPEQSKLRVTCHNHTKAFPIINKHLMLPTGCNPISSDKRRFHRKKPHLVAIELIHGTQLPATNPQKVPVSVGHLGGDNWEGSFPDDQVSWLTLVSCAPVQLDFLSSLLTYAGSTPHFNFAISFISCKLTK